MARSSAAVEASLEGRADDRTLGYSTRNRPTTAHAHPAAPLLWYFLWPL